MELALAVLLYVLGAVSGAVVMFAMMSDRLLPREQIYTPLDTIEQRSRSVQ